MPKKNAKAQKSNELDGAEFFAAINLIEKEKGIPKAYMLEKITQALVSAYKRDHEGAGDNVTVEADEEAGTVRMFVKKDVVEEVDNPCTEMSLQMAREKLPHAQLGDVIRIEVRTRDFGRIAAQTARQVIIQGMREAERGMIYDEFSSKEAVWSADPDVDPIGACVGPRGQRVNNIVEELKGEKVDIIKWSEEPAEYIAAALSPADVVSVAVREEGKACRVVVPDDQLSLAIGKEGQNARLAAKLTGWKIDIKPASAPADEEPEDEEDVLLDDEAETEE